MDSNGKPLQYQKVSNCIHMAHRNPFDRNYSLSYVLSYCQTLHRTQLHNTDICIFQTTYKHHIDSEASTIRAEGNVTEVLDCLASATAQILNAYFPTRNDMRLAGVATLTYKTIDALAYTEPEKEDTDED